MNPSLPSVFNIRVYSLIMNNKNEILLADELRSGVTMTKFPGGGLNFGEGILDCLHREAVEEFGQEIEVLDHFYTTDFYQPSLFNPAHQLLSIYYKAKFKSREMFRIAKKPFDFLTISSETISFRYAEMSSLNVDDLTFPIDRHVLQLLQSPLK